MKTAGDSIVTTLRPYISRNDFIIQNDFEAWRRRFIHNDAPHLASLHKHSTAIDVRSQLHPDIWSTYYKFAFVRHPISRAISFYTYIATKADERKRMRLRNAWYLTPPGQKEDPRKWLAMVAFLSTDSFSSFIRHPILDGARGMQPQGSSLCGVNGEVLVDFVGKFESLDADMAIVQDRIGVPRVPLARRNTSKLHLSGVPDPSPADREYLWEKYEDDFVRFGYKI